MEQTFQMVSDHEAATLYGLHDDHLKLIEAELGVRTVARGRALTLSGPEASVRKAGRLVQQLLNIIRSGNYLRRHEVVYAIRAMDEKQPVDLDPIYADKIEVLSKRQFITPKTAGQKAYVEAIRKHDIVFSIGVAGTGKCIAGSSLVLTDQGLVPIASLGEGAMPDRYSPIRLEVCGLNGREPASHLYCGGRSDTRRIHTRFGFEIEVTREHPLLKLDASGEASWARASELHKGDHVAIQRGQRLFGKEAAVHFQYHPNGSQDHSNPVFLDRLDEEFAYVMGVLTGDGCLTSKNRIILSSADLEILEAFSQLATRFGLHVFRNGKTRPYDRIIASSQLYQLMLSLGMSNGTAVTKRVPTAILRAPQPLVVAFLQGLFDSDGTVNRRDGYVQLSSMSERLLMEVHLLLLNLGILACKRTQWVWYRDRKRVSHLLEITGAEASRFYREIGFRLPRKQGLQIQHSHNANIDVVPHVQELIQAAVSGHEFPRSAYVVVRDYKYGRKSPGYEMLGRMVQTIGEIAPHSTALARLSELHQQRFFWAQIVGIEESQADVYDLTVPGSHSFCANGFVNHNTYLAMAMAVNALKRQQVSRIILTRPAVEAGESLGYLPGTFEEKVNPYLRPLYDALYDMMDVDRIQRSLERGILEVAPLAYMRGRTLNDSFIILDEAQNCTLEQMKMFLTRLGFESKAVITGDVTQSDLPQGKALGLVHAQRILKGLEGIAFVTLTDSDVVRHELVQQIVRAYESSNPKLSS